MTPKRHNQSIRPKYMPNFINVRNTTYNSFCTVVQKRKRDARPPAGRTSFFPTFSAEILLHYKFDSVNARLIYFVDL